MVAEKINKEMRTSTVRIYSVVAYGCVHVEERSFYLYQLNSPKMMIYIVYPIVVVKLVMKVFICPKVLIFRQMSINLMNLLSNFERSLKSGKSYLMSANSLNKFIVTYRFCRGYHYSLKHISRYLLERKPAVNNKVRLPILNLLPWLK
jgi:hypothetical protein